LITRTTVPPSGYMRSVSCGVNRSGRQPHRARRELVFNLYPSYPLRVCSVDNRQHAKCSQRITGAVEPPSLCFRVRRGSPWGSHGGPWRGRVERKGQAKEKAKATERVATLFQSVARRRPYAPPDSRVARHQGPSQSNVPIAPTSTDANKRDRRLRDVPLLPARPTAPVK